MHPGMFWWWKHGRGRGESEADCHPGGGGGCGPGDFSRGWRQHGRSWHGREGGGPPPWFFGGEGEFPGGGGFGVRRPLRFLAWKLELDDAQMAEIARILDDMKTERAQAAVDQRRTAAALADTLLEERFDATKAAEAASPRVESAERLRQATVRALERIHAVLRPEQRSALATMVRTGTVQL